MLVAYNDGELATRRAIKITLHLSLCGRCRRELDSVQADARRFDAAQAAALAPPRLEEGFQKLLQAARQFQLAHRATQQSRIRERVAAQLEMFFGSRALATIQKKPGSRPDGPGPLVLAEPLFSAFLGERAAALLAGRALQDVALTGNIAREQAS
jgi:anti-sigma factor RsiW